MVLAPTGGKKWNTRLIRAYLKEYE
jgi:hypothetical protein